jgi:hypothetical protein
VNQIRNLFPGRIRWRWWWWLLTKFLTSYGY